MQPNRAADTCATAVLSRVQQQDRSMLFEVRKHNLCNSRSGFEKNSKRAPAIAVEKLRALCCTLAKPLPCRQVPLPHEDRTRQATDVTSNLIEGRSLQLQDPILGCIAYTHSTTRFSSRVELESATSHQASHHRQDSDTNYQHSSNSLLVYSHAPSPTSRSTRHTVSYLKSLLRH